MADPRGWHSGRRVETVLDLWVVVPVLALGWPLLVAGGYPFARDLVFTPQLPLRPEAVGLGTSSPRAAPLDAVVGLLSVPVGGAVVGRVAVLGTLLLAGWGAHRAARRLPALARAVVGVLAVWNPFVVERMGLGQWALVLGYASLWWVVAVAFSPVGPTAGRLAPWLGLGALTPSAAVLCGAVALASLLGRRTVPRRTQAAMVLLVGAVQLPWLLPSLLGAASGTSDPIGVGAFAAGAEVAGSAWLSVLALGGIWDRLSVPGSREGLPGLVTAAVVAVALVVAALWGRDLVGRRLWVLGLGSFLVAGATTLPWVADVVESGSELVPGLGLLRDAQKWLAPFVVVAVLAVGVLAREILRNVQRTVPALGAATAIALVALPWLLLPDGAVVVNRVLVPSPYPSDFDAVARVVDGQEGVLASAPWRLYRQYPWATAYATYDPASRWFDTRVVTSDALAVGSGTVVGEDPYAAEVGRAVSGPADEVVPGLASAGVRWLLVTRTDPGADELLAATAASPSAERVVDGPALVLVDLASAGPDALAAPSVSVAAVVVVVLTDVVVLLVVAVTPLATMIAERRRHSVTLA